MHGVIAELFSQLTKEICVYLGHVLPRLSDDWWKEHVLAQLSFQQIQIVEQHKINDLSRLDLAALLRIPDHKRFETPRVEALSQGTRNFVKKLQTMHTRLSFSFPLSKAGGVQIWK